MMMFRNVSSIEPKSAGGAAGSEAGLNKAEAWAADNSAGRALAAAYIDQARMTENPLMISAAIRDMVKAGRWSGVEVGFMQTIAEAVIRD